MANTEEKNRHGSREAREKGRERIPCLPSSLLDQREETGKKGKKTRLATSFRHCARQEGQEESVGLCLQSGEKRETEKRKKVVRLYVSFYSELRERGRRGLCHSSIYGKRGLISKKKKGLARSPKSRHGSTTKERRRRQPKESSTFLLLKEISHQGGGKGKKKKNGSAPPIPFSFSKNTRR